MLELVITIIVGLIGGVTALKLNVPAGAMIGSMVITAVFNVITGKAFMPQDVKIITQIATGAFIGAGIKLKDVIDLKKMIKPAMIMVPSMIILDIIIGLIMYKTTDLDLVTSLFACAPGGIVDMSLISSDLGADSSKVALLQMIRLSTVLIIFPSMIKLISSRSIIKKEFDQNEQDEMNDDENIKIIQSKKEKYKNLGITSIIALISGWIGYNLKIPAGAMTFSMLTVGALNIFSGKGYMPLNIRRLTQVFAGILIGERMTYRDIVALKTIIIPAFILIAGIIVVNLCVGIFISKFTGLEMINSLLASAPGGMSDMALIAKDLGGDAPKVTVLQLARYICVIAFYPIIVKLISTMV